MPDTRLVTGEIVRADATTDQVIAIIEAPVRRELGDAFACRVCIPRLFAAETWVTGDDADHARVAALRFVETVFDEHGIRLTWRSPG